MKVHFTYIFGFLLLSAAFSTCREEVSEDFQLAYPAHFPKMEIPEDNALTHERVALGKMLFYEKALSRDSSMSCATCHPQSRAFADDEAVSLGIQNRVGFRNVPALGNIGYHPYFFREGGSPSLEGQVLGPICNFDEMGFNARELIQRLMMDDQYNMLAQEAYDRPMDLFVLTRAIAAFERTLITGDAPWDRFIQGDSSAMSESAQRGWKLFQSEKTGCIQCHNGVDFSDYSLQNNGLKEVYEDEGRYRVTVDSSDIGKFKVFSLRNVELTAPYMHDGSLKTLEEVIDHYNQGGSQHMNQSPYIKPLGLSANEKEELISFLKALTDRRFTENPAFGEE